MNKPASIIVTLGFLVAIGIIFFGGSFSKSIDTGGSRQNVEVREGVQYISIDAKGGYFPRATNAQAGIPTKLIVKTDGTYDCSASLVIRSVGYQKILPQTGEEVIDLGTQEAGESIKGLCGMGMYSFVVNFN